MLVCPKSRMIIRGAIFLFFFKCGYYVCCTRFISIYYYIGLLFLHYKFCSFLPWYKRYEKVYTSKDVPNRAPNTTILQLPYFSFIVFVVVVVVVVAF